MNSNARIMGVLMALVIVVTLGAWNVFKNRSAAEIEWDIKTKQTEFIAQQEREDYKVIGTACDSNDQLLARPHGSLVVCKAGVWTRPSNLQR